MRRTETQRAELLINEGILISVPAKLRGEGNTILICRERIRPRGQL
jgi:hypothetical protein